MSSSSNDNSLQNFLLGVLFGLLTGGILSLLFSPNSGTENRRAAKKWADDTTETLKEEMENPYSKLRQFVDEQKYMVEEKWNAWQKERKAARVSEAKKKEAEAWENREHDDDVVDVTPTVPADEAGDAPTDS